jgi:pimeloyl-ACP methyl ester carboxylesterase
MSAGLHYAVVCSEDVPRFDAQQLEQTNAGSYLGDQVSESLLAVCEGWPSDLDASRRQAAVEPVLPDLPTLLLSGENDPVTPPRHAKQVAAQLPRSLHLVAPGQGHGVVQRGCFPKILTAFVEVGTIEGLETACVSELRPASFFLDFSGPAP